MEGTPLVLITTNHDYAGGALPRLQGESADLVPGSPMAVIGLWVYALRGRFEDQESSPLPWVWSATALNIDTMTGSPRPDGEPTKILIEAGYNTEKAVRNYRPAIYVSRGGHPIQPAKHIVNNFVGQHLPSGLKSYHCFVTMPLVVDCYSDNAAESSTIGETVWGFMLATREIFRQSFGLHDIEEPILGDTVPGQEDKTVWVTQVQTRVTFDMRWSVTPISPKLREVWFELAHIKNPEDIYRKLAIR